MSTTNCAGLWSPRKCKHCGAGAGMPCALTPPRPRDDAPRPGSKRRDGTSAPTRPVPIRLTAAELAAIDGARGEQTRSDFVRAAVKAACDGAAGQSPALAGATR